jgi:hypothetical protein
MFMYIAGSVNFLRGKYRFQIETKTANPRKINQRKEVVEGDLMRLFDSGVSAYYSSW